ncbi:MAG: zinc ribbon domain-containing protein [Treponema sp.]|jgi:hypothetical protein|nr:zinc ribbon domain-containing protein [Treponema sp.]
MFCINCGKEIPNDSNFCLYCGISLSGSGIEKNEVINKGVSLIVINSEKIAFWGKHRIKIFVDGNFIKDVVNGQSISFEIEDGKHIIFAEAKWCNRSDSIEIKAESNEIHFSASLIFFGSYYKVILTRTKETEIKTWNTWE